MIHIPLPRRAAAVAGCLLALLVASTARAQGVTNPEYRAMYDDAFRATYADPANLQAAIEFAKVATLAGDLEGAIGALERVLIFNPNLPEVDLQLGQLYRALGSFEMARTYLRRADPSRLSAADRAARDRALAELEGALARHQLTGSVTVGLRHRENANAGPLAAARVASSSGVSVNSLRGRADQDAFAAANLLHVYDFDDQSGTTLESRATAYATRQFHRHRVNIALIELDTGPRFRFDRDAAVPNLRPYVIASSLELGGAEYFTTGGGGGQSAVRLMPNWSLEGTVEGRVFKFNNSSVQSTATNKDAGQLLGRVTSLFAPTGEDLLIGNFQVVNFDARRSYETYHELSLSGRYVHRFAAPWTWLEAPWSVQLAGGYANRHYDQADPTVDSTRRRVDGQWDLSGALTIGLTDRLDLRFEVSQVWANSNVALYQYRDTAVLGAVQWRF